MKTTTSLLLVCFSLLVACSMAQPQYQIDALMDFYNSTDGDEWHKNTNWGVDSPCTNLWYGIGCDENNQKITSIILTTNRLVGTILESFGQLSDLQKIELSYNYISAPIPQSFANLTSLTDLISRRSYIGGTFPDVLFSIPSLRNLDLGYNLFEGQLPDKFDSLPSLLNLDLSENYFNGSVPATILNNLSNCVINLDGNKLTSIPWDQWTNSNALSNSTLSLYKNQITGSLSYQIYWVNQIDLTFNLLNGTLPVFDTTKGASQITYFDVSFNKLTGSLPVFDTTNGIPKITSFNVSSNLLTGNLPVSLTKATNLNFISVEANLEMSGVIPVEYASMPNLLTLRFSRTNLICPDDSQWHKFEKIAANDCSYAGYSSNSPHGHLGLYITLFVGGIVLLLAVVVGLVIFFVVRYRRQRVLVIE